MENKVEKWINDYACMLVIAKLKEKVDNQKMHEDLQARL